MSWGDIATEIKSLVCSVSGVPTDNVYTRKVAFDKDNFKSLFHDSTYSTFIGFEIYKIGVNRDNVDTTRTLETEYNCEIHGFMCMEENISANRYSYTILDDLVEDIRDKLTVNRQINGTALLSDGPTQTEVYEEEREGNWCWATDIQWKIRERTTLTESPA